MRKHESWRRPGHRQPRVVAQPSKAFRATVHEYSPKDLSLELDSQRCQEGSVCRARNLGVFCCTSIG